MLHETFFSISISKNVFDFDKKYFTTNFRDEQCFIVSPSSKHVEGTPLDLPCSLSPRSDQNFKMAADEEDCSGEIYGR